MTTDYIDDVDASELSAESWPVLSFGLQFGCHLVGVAIHIPGPLLHLCLELMKQHCTCVTERRSVEKMQYCLQFSPKKILLPTRTHSTYKRSTSIAV